MGISLDYTAHSKDVEVNLPASKSESNRLLILQFLSGYAFEIEGLSAARDTQVLKECLQQIKERNKQEELELDCQDGGTQLRFLLALCSLMPGKFLLKGAPRLMERPQQELINSLKTIGAEIINLGEDTNGPWQINGGKLHATSWEISMAKSSQFASALLLIAPFMEKTIHLKITDREASWPYVEMTLATLKKLGVSCSMDEDKLIISPGMHSPHKLSVEADWSSAAFFYAAQAIRKQGSILLKNLSLTSVQGDAIIENLMRYEGMVSTAEGNGLRIRYHEPAWNKNELSINLINYPDLAPALVIYYLSEGRNVNWTGLESLKSKESKRDEVLAEMLTVFGARLESLNGHWEQSGSIKGSSQTLNTHDDHRMAMAFALLAITQQGISLTEVESVKKSFPNYWVELENLGIRSNPA